MNTIIPLLAEQFDGVFPELKAQQDFIARVIEEEEKSFLRTLELGLKKLDTLFTENIEFKTINGDAVFELSDTFGFPSDLTALIAREKDFKIDEAGFQKALQEQKARSRKDSTKEATDWVELSE